MPRRKVPETNATRHHLIPVSYMRRFSPDGRHVHVFDHEMGEYRFDNPTNIAVRREFNTLTTHDGRKERWPEAILADVDSKAAPCLDRLADYQPLSAKDRWSVAVFAGYAEARGTGFRESLRDGSHGSNDQRAIAFWEKKLQEAFAAASGVWLDMDILERMAREDAAHVASGMDDIGGMIWAAFQYAHSFNMMEWALAIAPEGTSFITGDRPIGVLKRWTDLSGRERLGYVHNPVEPGTEKVLPISPQLALAMGKWVSPPTFTWVELDAATVRAVNVAVAARSDRFVIASSEDLLRGVIHDARMYPEYLTELVITANLKD